MSYRWLFLIAGWLAVMSLSGPANAYAQTFGVAVTPAETTIVVPGDSRQTQRFWVKNTGTAGTRNYAIMGPACNWPVRDCVWSTFSLDIAQGDSGAVDVTFTAGPTGTTGNTHFDAVVNDQQTVRATGVVFVQASAPAPDGLTVTPSSGTEDVPPYAQARQKAFVVRNTSGRTVDVSIQGADCQPFEMFCAFSTQSISGLAPNAEDTVRVTFTSGPPGWSGTIALVAKINDNQAVAAPASVTVNVPVQAWVETRSLNPGTTIERSACVAFPVATNSAYECGELVIAHAMPSLRVRGDDRTPVLRYVSTHGTPTPVVAANISAPNGGATDVIASLTVRRGGSDVQVVEPTLFGSIASGTTRRIALAYDASSDTTGVYPYTLTVTMTVGGVPDTLTSSDTLVVVNRRTSAFGGGWWVAGYEQLVRLPGGGFLWVGGDGSTRRYVRDTLRAGEAYGAAGFVRPDSLVLDGSVYVRQLRHRARVEFDASGRHVATKEPHGVATTFQHDPSGRLEKIIHPTASQPFHRFFYNVTSGRLDSVTGPGPNGGTRRTRFHLENGAIRAFTDPDGRFVQFGYNTHPGFDIITRVNRNGYGSEFSLVSHRLVESNVPLADPNQDAIIAICPAEIRGLPDNGCDGGSVAADSAVTRIDGPRLDANDMSRVRTDRFGAPTVVTDALGNSTRLHRGERALPGLVTRVVHKNGWVNDSRHDVRGLLVTHVEYAPFGPGQDAVTSYTWDPTWERVTSVTFPEQNVVRFGYDATTGNRVWQEDGRPGADTTYFRYYPAAHASEHLLRAVDAPADASGARAVDSLAYDALGNVAESREGHQGVAPTVPRVTGWLNDGVGRPIRVSADINASGTQQRRDSTGYDLMDRVVHTRASAVGTSPAQEFLQTTRVYDDEGNLRRVERSASPPASGTPIGTIVSRMGYDQGNRVVADTAADGNVERHAYDNASNDTLITTRRGHTVRLSYDALNRLSTRTLAVVTYQKRNLGVANLGPGQHPRNVPYPRYPIALGVTAVGDTVIGGTTESFTYDVMGNLLTAQNDDAQVQRTYFSNGLIDTETLRIRAYGSGDFTAHTYLTGHEYDLNGRRTRLRYPQQFAVGGTPSSAQYQYSPTTGALEGVIDPLGATFTLHTDLRGQLDTLSLPGGIREAFGYDAAGRVLTDRMHNAGGSALRLTARTYDARDKALTSVNATGALDSHNASYTGLGYLAASTYADHGTNVYGSAVGYTANETLHHDGLGNVFSATTTTTGSTSGAYSRYEGGRSLAYHTLTGRVGIIDPPGARIDTIFYDSAGNTEFTTAKAASQGDMIEDRASYYDALGRVRAVDQRFGAAGLFGTFLRPLNFTFEEFRYDALGRRVLARTRRFCQNVPTSFECAVETIRRTVWDGAQELAEIQMPGGDTVSAATLENDVGPLANQPGGHEGNYFDVNPFYGRVTYTNGVGIDRPLSVVRLDYADSLFNRPFVRWAPFSLAPHWNLRGEPDNGSFADGAATKCMNDGAGNRCVTVQWPFGWTATMQQSYARLSWHGSLIESKRDGSGLLFRRNRYVDPASGRFTQEDPIGLAGGLNLYGFAEGDPVNYGDPFGLWPDWGKVVTGLMAIVGNYFGHLRVGESQMLVELGSAEVLRTEAEKADEFAEGTQKLRKAVAAGGKPPAPPPRAGMSAASIARGVGGKVLPAAGLGVSILTSYKHGENESLPEMVCRIEKCDPSIKVIPDKPRKPER
jgi:RHS repeat-associated protein